MPIAFVATLVLLSWLNVVFNLQLRSPIKRQKSPNQSQSNPGIYPYTSYNFISATHSLDILFLFSCFSILCCKWVLITLKTRFFNMNVYAIPPLLPSFLIKMSLPFATETPFTLLISSKSSYLTKIIKNISSIMMHPRSIFTQPYVLRKSSSFCSLVVQ